MDQTTFQRQRLTLIMQIAGERLKLNPRDADALFAMAAAQATLDDPRGALRSVDRLAELEPNYPGLWVLKTKLHARLGEVDRARQSRLRAQQAETGPGRPTEPTIPCPMCEAPVAVDATACSNCGVKFAPTRNLEDELEDLGHAAIQEIVQEDLQTGVLPMVPRKPPEPGPRFAPAPKAEEPAPPKSVLKPTPKKALTNGLVLGRGASGRKGMTNGLRGRTNGLRGRTNGLTNGLGRTNGLTNDVGRTNGLTNGLGRTNGLTNGLGRTNGLTNGLGRTNGITNGLGRTNGLTNGLGAGRAGFRASGFRGMMRTAGWKLYVIPLVVAGLLLMPLFFVPEYGPATPIRIDGQFGDWVAVTTAAMGSGALLNPNIDVARFGVVDNLGPHAFYVQVAGIALQGGGASPGTMDSVRIFVDTDGLASTGYRIDGLGADRLIEVSGYAGAVRQSTLWEFDANRDLRDWSGWIKGTAIPAAATGAQIEAEAKWLSGTSSRPFAATVHTASWDGQSDIGDFPIGPSGDSLSIVAEPQVPSVIAGNDVPLLRLTLTGHGQPLSLDTLTVQIVGTAAPTAVQSLRLLDAGSVLDQVVPASRDVTFTFPAIAIGEGSVVTFSLVGDFSATNGDTFGLRLPSTHPFGTGAAAVGLRENPGTRMVGYLGTVPSAPTVDGGFGEWTSVRTDAAGDVSPPGNSNVDLTHDAAQSAGGTTHLYADVTGRILQGTPVPEAPSPTPVQSPPAPADTDRDTVPDASDPLPLDFNNDGIADADTNGDYDGDLIVDYGFGGGTDAWLNTTLPVTFPVAYAGRAVSIYIGPTQRPPALGEDVLRLFLDLDNSTASGYAIAGIGADRLVEVRGKDGQVTQSALLSFSGSFPGAWSWTPISPVTVAAGYHGIELSVSVSTANAYVEASDFWGAIDSSTASPALAPSGMSFQVSPASRPMSVPWTQVGPQPSGTLIDSGSNSATTVYNHQRKVVRAGDVPVDTVCDASNSDGCWYAVFSDQFLETGTTTAPTPKVKVQNGASAMAAGTAWLNVTITSVDATKSFLVFGASFNEVAPQYGQVSGQITSSTNIRFQRFAATGSSALSLEWYVAEFPSGVSVQRGSTAPGSGTPANVTIASVNLAKSFPLVSYRMSGNDFDGNDFVRAKITSATSLELVVTEFSTVDAIAEWQVVEYTDASVQRGDVAFATTDSSRTATIASVNTTKSWLLFTYQSPTGTLANIGQKMVRGVITNPTTLTFDRVNTGQTITLTWYLIEFADSTFVQQGTASFTTAETQKDVAVQCVDLAKTVASAGALFYAGGRTPYSADDNPGVARTTLDLTNSSNLRLTRGVTGSQTADVGWFVVSFAADVGCRIGGTFTTDIETENNVYIQYREATRGNGFLTKLAAFNVGTGGVGTTVAITGVGFQPKVVIFWWSGRTESTDTTNGANIARGFGVASSPTDRRSVYSQSQDGAAVAAADSGHHDAAAIGALTTAGAVDGLADLQSMDSNGFTLVIDDAFAINLRVHYLALGGPELTNVATGMFTEPASIGNQDITTVGFQPDAAIFFSAMIGANPPGTAVDSSMMIGAAAGATPANAVWAGGSNDGADPTQSVSHADAGQSIALLNTAVTETDGRASVTSWLSNGFRLNWAERAASRLIHYVALQGGSYLIGDLTAGLDTTTPIVETGFGFSPKAGLLLSHDTGQSSADGTASPDRGSLGGFASPWEQGVQASKDEDALATTQTSTSVEHDGVWVRISSTDTLAEHMQIRSVDADGFTAMNTVATGAVRFVWYLAFGGATKVDVRYDWSGVPGTSHTLKVKGYRQDENIDVQVLTPPSTWNTRITITATTNTLYTYALTSSEYNSGSPSVRFVDVSSDQTKSDLWVDLAVIEAANSWDRIVLMRSSDTSGSTWGSQIILASARSGDSPLLYSYDSAEPSIALDASGYLHVVWVSAASAGDQTTLNRVRYAKTTVAYPTQAELANAANWEAVTVVDDASPGFMPTVSTDANNAPHLAWSESKTSGTVYYKNKVGGAWKPTVSWGTTYTGLSVDVSPQNSYVSLARYHASSWYDSNWQFRKKITVDHTKVTADLTNFPVLVDVTDTDLRDDAQDDGDDILFTGSDGTTKLNHEIEEFNGATGKLVAWVNITSLSSTIDPILYMYYGYAAATNQQNVAGTWDANYKGVWHLDESPNDGVAGHDDSTANNNDGTPLNFQDGGGGTTSATGRISGADDFGGDDDYINVPNSASLDITGDKITIEAWIKLSATFDSSATQHQTIIDGGGKIEYWLDEGDGKLHFSLQTGSWLALVSTQASWTAGAWYHLVAVYNGANRFLYVNGPQDSTIADTGNLATNSYTRISDPAPATNEGPFDGIIDEVRISDVGRSAGWVQTTYNNRNDIAFYSVGSEEGGSEVQFVACKDLSASGCDAASEFTKWDGTAGYDVVASGVDTSYPSLATTWEANGDLWIAYAKDVNGTTRAIYARFLDYPSGGWAVAETVDSLASTIFTRPSIGVDRNGDVHALYVATSGPQLYYKARAGGSWGSRTAVDTTSDNPTLVVRAPDHAAFAAPGGLYWKSSTSETYFYYIPEFEMVTVPILGVFAIGLLFCRRVRRHEDDPRERKSADATPKSRPVDNKDVPRQ